MPKPAPIPDPESTPFWNGAAQHRLVIQCCTSCGTFRHPPGFVCGNCGSRSLEFREVSGSGTLYSFTVSEQAFVPGFEDSLPLVIGLVQLDVPGIVRFLCNIPLELADQLVVDMPMRVAFEELESGEVIPQFLPA
ncbi:MAG TPA: OB-fold domain-containing protein [Solirubrobacteraceae bacterium]|jgi:hypothetical protein|nr:OB-fold domain-containing protein [Solirubrobacteraceae bacterium]